MSFILDALNKSEQERRAQSAPDLNTQHAPARVTRGPAHWGWLFGCVLVSLNLAALALWFSQRPPATQPTTLQSDTSRPDVLQSSTLQSSTLQSSTSQSGAPQSEASMPALVNPAKTDNPATVPETIITPADLGQQATNRLRSTISIADLSPELQQQLPDMRFSSHLYSDDFRLVNINGQMMREGEAIAPGVVLLEITVEGVVIAYRDQAIAMSVLRDWSFD